MDRKLTTEFAEEVRLPRNPISRHAVVAEMLEDPVMIGEDTVVSTNSALIQTSAESVHVHVNTAWPLLGRGALRKVAQTLEYSDNL